MNQYIIQQKINTISKLSLLDSGELVPMTIDEIEFNQWDFNWAEGCKGNAWIVMGKENADNYHKAVFSFRKKLSKIVPRVAFISQCFMDYGQESFLAFKINNNPEKIAFVHHTTGRNTPGLMFMEEERNNFNKLKLENDEFFWYINDCYNAIGYTAKLLLMFAALESLAGKEVKIDKEGEEYETYNKENMKAILGDELYNKIYGKNGLRHKLSHGEYINSVFSGTNYVEILHNKILMYFNSNFDMKLNTAVVNPQRHPFGNAYLMNVFIKPKENTDTEMSLKNILEDFDANDVISNQTLNNFDFVFKDYLENY